MTDFIDSLTQQRDALACSLEDQLSAAEQDGRGYDELSPTEQRTLERLHHLDARIEHAKSERARAGDLSHLQRATSEPGKKTMFDDRHLTYRKGGRDSWIRDLVRVQRGLDDTYESRNRLAAHADDVRTDPNYMEFRDLSRVDGSGGYAVPPAWLLNQYVELARPGRPFADLCAKEPLPGGTDSINIPKVLTGTSVGIQGPPTGAGIGLEDNLAVTETDLTDTFINAPVRTIAGQQGVSLQLIDQSPIAFDEVIFRDLTRAYATAVDLQVQGGTGTNGQVLGVTNTANIHTIAVASQDIVGVYKAIANAIQLVHTTRFLPPEVIVMHPRRWGWLLSLLDPQSRPLFLPAANGLFNAAGVLTDVASQQVVGHTHGLPIVTDPNISTTSGAETPTGTEDNIYVLRASDLILWESGVRARVLPETRATTLTVLCQAYGYIAFSAARYPQSIVEITGLVAPTF